MARQARKRVDKQRPHRMGDSDLMIDVDQFESTAAWLQYCDGMSQFQAETEAARRQGILRKEALHDVENSKRNTKGQRDNSAADARHNAHNLPAVQSHPAQQERPVPERDVQG